MSDGFLSPIGSATGSGLVTGVDGGAYRDGFAAGLDAAREAVKSSLPHAHDCRAFCPCCMGDYDCNCERREALDAIDALREGQR